jgi:crossover junction endodeoxyribonuclease RuvC
MNILAIDPGESGGYVISTGDDLHVFTYVEKDAPNVVRSVHNTNRIAIAYLEDVHSSFQMGVASAFTFGRNVGKWEGILDALQIPTVYVSPQIWQKPYQQLKGIQGPERKRILKQIAKETFPNNKITLANADALLIWQYAKQLRA